METNNMRKLLTFIIPSYKTAPYVENCLERFLNPLIRPKVSVFLIDDGSPDEQTPKLLKFYSQKYPDLFLYWRKENGGHGSTINFGIPLIQTPYFRVLDGDDWIDEKETIKFLEFLESVDDDIVLSPFVSVIDGGKKLVPSVLESDTSTVIKASINDIVCYSFGLPNVTFKASLWKENKIKIREKVFYEDREYAMLPLLYAKTFSSCSFFVYQYRMGSIEQSVSVKSQAMHYHDLYLVSNDLIDEYLLAKDKNLEISKLIGFESTRLAYELLKAVLYPTKNVSWAAKRNDLVLINKRIIADPVLKKSSRQKAMLFFRFVRFRFLRAFAWLRVARLKNKTRKS